MKRKTNLIGWGFIAPAMICFVIFLLFPAIMAIYLSFTSYNGFTPSKFIGLDNYIRSFQDPIFLNSLKNVGIYVALFVPIVVILSFLLAVLLNNKMKGIKIFRILFYLPCLTSAVASSMVWKWLMNPSEGLLNQIFRLLHIPTSSWLNNSKTAMISIVIICVWSALASNIMIYLSALQNVPDSVYESAELDGAGPIRRLVSITFPLVAPTTYFVITMALIGAFQVFDQVYVLTSGGPANSTTVPLYLIYTNAFKEAQVGYACSQAMILFLLIMAITLIQRKYNKESLI
ncbi:carbohydrate ABC transporter permease [Enterococcus sp. S86.2]|uniref:carbohydrate ABC transporter permease n=1 Tax=Enterococcus sp. S86.2 TaxID=3031299 RepID=UPI0026F2DAE6|nr:sugar ABC transporter permease [Enterococcus sp. S86.2]